MEKRGKIKMYKGFLLLMAMAWAIALVAASPFSATISIETTKNIIEKEEPAKSIQQKSSVIVDSYLREAVFKLVDSVASFNPPLESQELQLEQINAVLQISVDGRRVFSAYERYQILFGVKKSLEIRPIIREAFKSANNKLAWIKERRVNNQNLRKAHTLMIWRYEQVKSDTPIARASTQDPPI